MKRRTSGSSIKQPPHSKSKEDKSDNSFKQSLPLRFFDFKLIDIKTHYLIKSPTKSNVYRFRTSTNVKCKSFDKELPENITSYWSSSSSDSFSVSDRFWQLQETINTFPPSTEKIEQMEKLGLKYIHAQKQKPVMKYMHKDVKLDKSNYHFDLTSPNVLKMFRNKTNDTIICDPLQAYAECSKKNSVYFFNYPSKDIRNSIINGPINREILNPNNWNVEFQRPADQWRSRRARFKEIQKAKKEREEYSKKRIEPTTQEVVDQINSLGYREILQILPKLKQELVVVLPERVYSVYCTRCADKSGLYCSGQFFKVCNHLAKIKPSLPISVVKLNGKSITAAKEERLPYIISEYQ